MQDLNEVVFSLDNIRNDVANISTTEARTSSPHKGLFCHWEKVSLPDKESGKCIESVVGKIKDLNTEHFYSILPQNIFFCSVALKLYHKEIPTMVLSREQRAKK